MKRPKKCIITGHFGNKLAKETAEKAISLLHNRKLALAIDSSFQLQGANGKPLPQLNGDIALAFGGDGTMLYAVAGLKPGVPVLGINCGERGALMACGAAEAEECIEKVLKGNYRVEERMRLAVHIDGKRCGEVLNEVVVAPKETAEMMRSRIEVGGGLYVDERSDGVIVSTPTGSNGHALSAGGAVVDAGCDAMEIVSMGSATGMRPLVVPANAEVRIAPGVKKGLGGCVAVLDGRERVVVKKEVVVRKGSDAEIVFVSGMRKVGALAEIAGAGAVKMPASAKLILLALKRQHGMKQGEIARACGLPLRTVARNLKALRAKGIVKKQGRRWGVI